MQDIPQLLGNLAYGAAIGGALGLTGTGGSILAVPILVYLVGQDVHTAIGTSLAVVGGIAAEGVVEQRDSVQWKPGLLLGAYGIAGSIPGSLLSPYVSSSTLLLLFSGLAIAASISMLLSKSTDEPWSKPAPQWVVFIAGLGIGFLTGFLGVGVGFLIVPTMVFAFACSMQTAIATSLLVIAFNSAVGLVTRFATASIDWSIVGAFLVGGVAGNIAAAMLVHRLDQRRLKRIFAVFILLVGLFTAASAIGLIPIHVK
ncbi:sulfite exporter TauE/SafE family protein [Mesorhizobium qingshengii]|uniref:Probable membrane transporter protein n=1 Tax=Mesorhizobium qingshengii TaxID=1165689 RepID=A0ABT4R326_9HYPH|nr:sulfite exporter TauE/SafE family protein [Mesorhizobium qingshengii]MCZ8548149.1 sulfite exporter TauE/SafE family protein [Mesorhizobium qingshengii]